MATEVRALAKPVLPLPGSRSLPGGPDLRLAELGTHRAGVEIRRVPGAARQRQGERATASSSVSRRLWRPRPGRPPAAARRCLPAVALGSPGLPRVKSKVNATRGGRAMGRRSLRPRRGGRGGRWEEPPAQGVMWAEPCGRIWVETAAERTRDGGLATQARGAAPRTPRGSFGSLQPPLLTSLEKGLRPGGTY